MDSTFWAMIAFFLLLGLMAYLKVPAMVGRSLDARAERIRDELDEARSLREEAQALLAEYSRKRKEAEKEAGDIVASAQREAAALLQEAKEKSEDYIVRRNKLAEQKIAQAESDAVSQVRTAAVDIAVAAASELISTKLDSKAANTLFKTSLTQVKESLN